MDAEALLRELTGLLEASGIPYMLTGSLASSFHGEPRSTRDIDVVIDPEPGQLEALGPMLPEEAYSFDLDAARAALARRTQFNVVDYRSGWKIDFIIRKERPFSREEFERRRAIDLDGVSLVIASPEDVLLAKLEWAHRSGGSERQIEDAAGIVASQGAALDRAYVERWAEDLGVTGLWHSVLEEAAE